MLHRTAPPRLLGRQTKRGISSVPSTRGIATRASAGKREPWDVGRFVKTLTFFNGPPSLEKFLKGLFGGGAQEGAAIRSVPTPTAPGTNPLAASGIVAVPMDGAVMVAGATGGVGKRVVQRLLGAGKHVRALVRDLDKAQEMLGALPVAAGGKLELVAADITQRQTLLPEYFRGVRALVICTAVKVGPKDDTPDRAKYYQGIKFFDPSILENTPEAVELNGMRHLLGAAAPSLGQAEGITMLQAGTASAGQWGPLDDVVMGGVSISQIVEVQAAGEAGGPAMVFKGLVSTNNSGGFASVRCRNFEPALDCGAHEGIELRLKGDGQRFKAILRPDANWDGIAYCSSFDTRAGEWQTIRLPFASFFPVFRAKTVKDGPRLDPSKISSFQLMLSKFEYDGQLNPSFRAGQFELPISHIKAYGTAQGAPKGCKVVHVSSAGVTRPNRPGINPEMEPPAVRMNDMLGGILTYKLAGEDELRSSGLPHAIVRPCALTEEPRGMPLEFDQGDVIKGKISRDDVAELCVALLSEPSGKDTTFEIKSTVPFSQPWTVDEAAPPPKRDWPQAIAGAGLRKGVTGKTVGGVYTGKNVESEAMAARV